MEDVAVPIIADACDILHRAQRCFEIGYEVFRRFKFRLHFKIGKSNAIMRIAGPGAREATLELADAQFMVKCAFIRESLEVPVVDAYQHLGRLTEASLDIKPHINMRSVQCATELRPIAVKCFRQPGIKIEEKVQIAKAHLFSILCARAQADGIA